MFKKLRLRHKNSFLIKKRVVEEMFHSEVKVKNLNDESDNEYTFKISIEGEITLVKSIIDLSRHIVNLIK